MSFRGLLNDTCDILARVEGQDEATGQTVSTLEPVAQGIKCAFQNGGGSIDRTGRIQMGNNTDRIYLFPLDFDLKKHFHVIAVRGEQYNITELTDLGGRKRYMRVNLERVALDD